METLKFKESVSSSASDATKLKAHHTLRANSGARLVVMTGLIRILDQN
jgi:hypothetical protein